MFGAVLVAGVLLHDVGQVLTTILFVCLCVAVYRYAGHDEGEAPTTLRDWDDEHRARVRAHVTLRREAEAHRAVTLHFSSSAQERAEAYSALVRDFADGRVDVAAYRRRLRSTGSDAG
ncbi:hypothetical protein [Streptomyces sp. URMC 124]|uniref:hypothetical protein n=1 Tax=Streptomyces sp. URMC 124 TaxID=3423405 RepID=UPI003F1E13A8